MKRQYWIIAALIAFAVLSALLALPAKPADANAPGQEVYRLVRLDADGRPVIELNRYLHSHSTAVFVLGVATCLLSLRLDRRWNAALLALYLLFIAYMTLMYRDAVANRLNLTLFWSYRQFGRSFRMRQYILFNIWLFMPLGLILYRLTGRPWVVLITIAISGAIELAQYALGIGLCELDDIVSNGLGACLGCLLGIAAGRLRDLRSTKEA